MTDVTGPLTGVKAGRAGEGGLSRTGVVFAAMVGIGLALPLVQFRPNRIMPGDGVLMSDAMPAGLPLMAVLAVLALVGLVARAGLWLRLGAAMAGLSFVVLALGLAARGLTGDDAPMARVSPGAGFWVLSLGFALMATDALSRLDLALRTRALFLVLAAVAVVAVPASGWLDQTSVMVEHAARSDLFARALRQHLVLAFGSLGLALGIGLPLGMAVHRSDRLRKPLLGLLNMLQTIPSLALFGIMIPVFGWIAASVPGAAAMGVAGIGVFPALVALFLYALLPVVSNTWIGLASVPAAVRDAASGLGMTRGQVLWRVELPLAVPVILAAVRIVLVQNIGLAVIAGLIGGGGFGTFVFQGLNQTAMDLILLGALPTIFLAMLAGIGLDLLVEALSRRQNRSGT